MSKFAYEDISEVIFNYAGVTKHGTHNQKTHGGKGGGSEPTFASIGDFYEHMQKPENRARTYEEDQALTTSQKPEYGHSAVTAYVNNSSDLNTALRENPEFAERKFGSVIADLDETMVRVPNITESITVYRGVRGGDDFPEALKGLEAGDSFFDSAFTSTTLNPG